MCNHHLRFLIRSCLQGHPLKGVEKGTDKISAREKSAARETTQTHFCSDPAVRSNLSTTRYTASCLNVSAFKQFLKVTHQCTAVLDTFTELGRALDTLLSNVLLNFCPNLGSAALTCDTQRCSFTQNPTHNCDTQSFTLEYYCLKHNSQLWHSELVQQFHIEGNTTVQPSCFYKILADWHCQYSGWWNSIVALSSLKVWVRAWNGSELEHIYGNLMIL